MLKHYMEVVFVYPQQEISSYLSWHKTLCPYIVYIYRVVKSRENMLPVYTPFSNSSKGINKAPAPYKSIGFCAPCHKIQEINQNTKK
jgi:hypothetical protein